MVLDTGHEGQLEKGVRPTPSRALGGVPCVNALRDLLALDPGLEGKSPAPLGAAGDLSRAMQFLSLSPANKIKGGAQSCSFLEDAVVAIFEKGSLPMPGRGCSPHSRRLSVLDRLPRRPFLFWVERHD